MNEISTITLLQELCKRLSDAVYDIEPQYDAVLTPMPIQFSLDLHRKIEDYLEDYTKGVEDGVY